MTRIAVPASWTGFRRTGAAWLEWWQGLATAIALRSLAALLLPCMILFQSAHAQSPARQAAAASTQRVALVIGNAAYRQQSLLANPVNDARAISQALRESGFTVITRENADQRTMIAALREFGDKLRAGGTGLFYFSGHGMQIKGRNYLVPVDAAFEREDEIAYKTVDAQSVLDKMEAAGNAANIMILDACRTNPFIRSSRNGQQGLAQMDAPVGTLIAYATSPGTVASDGRGVNGMYTAHLLTAMRQPGNKVEDVFKQVRSNVRRESGGTQVPWEATSLEGDFYFRGGSAPAQQAIPQLPQDDPLDMALWDTVRNSTVPIEVAAYLNRYPSGKYAADARLRLSQLTPGTAAYAAANPSAGATSAAPAATATPATSPPAAINASGYATGDQWRFQVVDRFKNQVVRNYTDTVDSLLPDGAMSINGGQSRWDAKGNPVYTKVADSEDAYSNYVFIPPVLQGGARTAMAYQISHKRSGGTDTESASGVMVVRKQETVRTPAGEFNAWRVEIDVHGSGQANGANRWRWTFTGWYVPQMRNYVAYEDEVRSMSDGAMIATTGGYITRRERHELTGFSVHGAEKLANK